MTMTASTMLPLGTKAPPFSLPDTTGKTVSLSDFTDAKALLVIFMCNHCPFVIHIRDKLAEVARTYQEKGVAVVGISANDAESYPDDAPAKLAEAAKTYGFTFPYLYDESQEVAKAYRAACTPDFYLFDADHKLVYRGQFDDARPGNDAPVTGADLEDAIKAVIANLPVPEQQKASLGCNIKWKEGNEPEYFV